MEEDKEFLKDYWTFGVVFRTTPEVFTKIKKFIGEQKDLTFVYQRKHSDELYLTTNKSKD